ncbi:MAG: hypothetical protein P9L94_19240 [Candidatus Hinthialibacter antarcticus]|nr:hypothetical protein [Candidatus Hinthialibacter antarcticus]
MKKNSRIFPAGLVWGLALIVVAASFALPSFAQDDEDVIIPLGISPLSVRTAVLSFPLSAIGNEGSQIPIPRLQEIEELTIVIEDLTDGNAGLDIAEDFLPLSASALSSGVALYQESSAQPDSFSYFANDPSSDIPVNLIDIPTVQVDPTNSRRFFITFKPVSGSSSSRVPLIQDSHPDFHIVVQTTLNWRQGDRFEAMIPANSIKIRDRRNPLPKNTLYETPFPDDAFVGLNPLFAERQIFQGDIVQIVNLIKDTDNSFRIDAKSEARTLLGFDFVGRPDEDYFIKEVKVNFVGLNLASVAHLISAIGTGINFGGQSFASVLRPTYFYNPFFYNFPEDPENPGMIWMEERNVGGEEPISYPKTMPLNFAGIPREAFFTGNDNLNSHVLSYVPYGPRPFGSSGLEPTHTTNQDIFLKPLERAAGGIFLYREIGGQAGKFDNGVDRVIALDPSQLEISPFDITADDVAANPALQKVLERMIPGSVGGTAAKRVIPWLFSDSDLSSALAGLPADLISSISDESIADGIIRPPLGSLECFQDPDCMMFDQLINISRPFLGLTEGQVRYLTSLSGNEKSNLLDLYNFPLLQGFTITMPVSRNNAVGDLRSPNTRAGANGGPEMYLAVKTSDKVRSLDSIIPFIQPTDVIVGSGLASYAAGATDESEFESVSSVGMGRPNTSSTTPLIGRPRPRFSFQDLTQPGEGVNASNNNVIFDRTLSSPPKAVVGIDAIDFGQNPTLLLNGEGVSFDLLDAFFTESTVLGEMQVDFLPGTTLTALAALFSVIPLELGVTQTGPFIATSHSIAIYQDDDTPTGDNRDNDGDGLFDEELYNLQDDDGDGLIDEDLGDLTPAGENGVFDANDRYMPFTRDQFGSTGGFAQAAYVFPPNNLAKFEEYITSIEPADTPFDRVDGQILPLRVGEGSWFAELDFRVLNFSLYQTIRSLIYPFRGSRPFRGDPAPDFGSPRYNQGMFPTLDPRMGLIDLYPSINAEGLYSEDLKVVTPDGEEFWMLTFGDLDEDNIPWVRDPDGDIRRSFLLSLASALRFPSQYGFVKVGQVPMVVGVEAEFAENANDPIGPDQPDVPIYTQFGHYTFLGDNNTIGDYLDDFFDTFGDAVESALENIDNYNQEVADADAEAADSGEAAEYPDVPDPVEVAFQHPYSAIGISNWHETGDYDTSYMYQIQIPDENFGPLAGNDFFVTLRMSQLAKVGDSFRVRMRSGELGAQYSFFDTDDGSFINVDSPEGGIAYHSFLNTDYIETEPFRGISKSQLTTGEIVVQSQNVSPRITFQSPTSGANIATSDFTYQISYVVQDPDDSPQVALFVDDNGIGFDGTFIGGSLVRPQVGLANSFTLRLLDQIPDFDPTQEYYIYARVDDGVNPLVYTYADGPIITLARTVDSGGNDPSTGLISVDGELPNKIDMVKALSDGRTFSLGDLPSLGDLTTTDIVVDIEPNSSFTGMIGVQRSGGVLAAGDVGVFLPLLQANGTLAFKSENTAFLKNSVEGAQLIVAPTAAQIALENVRDVEVDYANGAIYVLDGDGDMLFLGSKANTALRPPAVGLDIYRDMELTPRADDMYFLTGNGVLTLANNVNNIVWSDLKEDVNFYTDIELVVKENTATNVVIVNKDGGIRVTGAGSGTNLRSAVFQPQLPSEVIDPGTVRQVKVFPGVTDRYILVEGSGEIHYFGVNEIPRSEIPSDAFVFADTPGLDDDAVVDVETGNVNLQSVIATTYDIIDALNSEDAKRIVSHAAPGYLDKQGADVNGLKKSLNSFFDLTEVISITQSKGIENSFTLLNEGDTIRANLLLDMSYYLPICEYQAVDITDSAVAGETVARMFFVDNRPAEGQTLRIREVLDGRAWLIDVYLIKNFGRMFEETSGSEDPEFSIYNELTRLSGNKLIATYAPKNAGVDKPMFIEVPELNQFEQYALLFIHREQFLRRSRTQPVLEIAWYPGTFLSTLGLNRVEIIYKKSADGQFRMSSMSSRIVLAENDGDFDFFDGLDETVLSEITDLEVEQPWGFSFDQRGPVFAVFSADADLVMGDGTFITPDPRSAIMMLPEGIDIYSLDPETIVNSLTHSMVLANPFDTGEVDFIGHEATYIPGRSYFVITRDGKHYGFIQIPDDVQFDTEALDFALGLFEYRYQDDFILPGNF